MSLGWIPQPLSRTENDRQSTPWITTWMLEAWASRAARIRTYTHIYMYEHTYINSNWCTCLFLHRHTNEDACLSHAHPARVHTNTHHIYTYIHTHTHTYIHTYIHTHADIHTHRKGRHAHTTSHTQRVGQADTEADREAWGAQTHFDNTHHYTPPPTPPVSPTQYCIEPSQGAGPPQGAAQYP